MLYMSCHSVLEYDELRILNDLGYDVTSIGSYIDPKIPHSDIRPPLNISTNIERSHKIHHLYEQNLKKGISPEFCSNTLTKEVVDDYDVIIVMHKMDWIEKNWDVLKNKIVILRTIGQNLQLNEKNIQEYRNKGIKIIRYSPKERELTDYAGEDTVLRFLKYKSDFKPRKVLNKNVISFGQNIKERGNACNSHVIEYVSKCLNFKLFGPHNENYDFFGGNISYQQQIEELSINGCYLYTGTFPAQYTLNFIEALMSGIPIVSIGRQLCNQNNVNFPFEVPDILDQIDGFYYDSPSKIVSKFEELLSDEQKMSDISSKQINLATKLFSVEKNGHLWKEFLNNL